MRSRVESLVGERAEKMWVGTFHSTAVKILRREAQRIGIVPSFVIFDEDDTRAALRRVLDELRLDPKRYPIGALSNSISQAKSELKRPEDIPNRSYHDEILRRVYDSYEEVLRRSGGLDFDDLIMKLVQLYSTDVEALAKWRDRFRHVLVDEYQDTNRAQYVLVNLVAGEHRNLAVVGDDDQCLVAGSLVTMGDGTARPIEEVAPGEHVLSGYGAGQFRPARVLRVHRSPAPGPRVAVTTRAGLRRG